MSKTKTEKRPAAQGEPSKAQWTWREMKKNKVAYVMIAPFMLLFFVFTVFPVLLSIVLSFTDFNLLEFPHFLGLNNYIRLFLDDDIFILACQNTLIFASITGPVSYLLSLLIAWFINELGPKLRSVVTLVFYAPSISGSVYLVWQTLFSSDSYGWVNGTLINLGIIDDAILWFKDADYVMPLCIVVALWTSLGTAFLSFIAGLQNVPRHLYEAGAVVRSLSLHAAVRVEQGQLFQIDEVGTLLRVALSQNGHASADDARRHPRHYAVLRLRRHRRCPLRLPVGRICGAHHRAPPQRLRRTAL